MSQRPLRILAWNIANQARVPDLRPQMRSAIQALKPGVIVLNEYVHKQVENTREAFFWELAAWRQVPYAIIPGACYFRCWWGR